MMLENDVPIILDAGGGDRNIIIIILNNGPMKKYIYTYV